MAFSNELTLTLPPEIGADEARLLLAIQLFEDERVSLGRAAEVAGYSKRAFIEILGHRGVPVIDYPPEDLDAELALDLGNEPGSEA